MWSTQLLRIVLAAGRRQGTAAMAPSLRQTGHRLAAAGPCGAGVFRRSLATVQPSIKHEIDAVEGMHPPSDPTAIEAPNESLTKSIREFLGSTRQHARAGLKPDELIVKCPGCSPGKPRRLAYSAHLNTHTGSFVCTNCFAQGSWDKYLELASKKKFQNTIPRTRSSDPPPLEIPAKMLASLQQNLVAHEDVYGWLTGTEERSQRRLSAETLAAYGVGLGFVDPSVPEVTELDLLVEGADHMVPCLVYPRTTFRTNSFFEDGGAEDGGAAAAAAESTDAESLFHTVQLKLVSWCPKESKGSASSRHSNLYYPSEQTQPGLFGFHVAASSSSSDVILTARELDAMAAYQATGIPAVSLPRNSYQLPLDSMRALEPFERVYVWLDDNQQGIEAAQLIARKLGVDRSLVVRTRDGSHRAARSAGDALARGLDMRAILDEAQPLQHDKVLSFAALRDAVRFEVTNPDLIRGVESKDLPGWNACFKGLRPGELTILSGPTGCGKTTVISQLSLDFCRSGVSTLWGSFEIPNVRLATRMMSQYARTDISKSPKDVDYWSRRFGDLPMYFLKFHGSTKPETVLDTMRHAVYAYDVKHIVIDNLQFMMSMQAKGVDKYDAQDAAIATFRQFATDENVHITVVAHLRKDSHQGGSQGSSSGDADINSVFGSAKVTQEADNVVILQRYGSAGSKIRVFNVLKNRFDGTVGKVYISYSSDTMTFKEIPPPRQRKITVVRTVGKADELPHEAGIEDGEVARPPRKTASTRSSKKARVAGGLLGKSSPMILRAATVGVNFAARSSLVGAARSGGGGGMRAMGTLMRQTESRARVERRLAVTAAPLQLQMGISTMRPFILRSGDEQKTPPDPKAVGKVAP
ncbi:hypothetical protein GGI15_004080, partial [Coemansia interrupta]